MESKKMKMENNDLFRYETNKEKRGAVTSHGQLFSHYLQLRQEPLTVSEIGKSENPLVSAF